MALPKAVQAQVDEANRLAEAAAGAGAVPVAADAATVVGQVVPKDGAPTHPTEPATAEIVALTPDPVAPESLTPSPVEPAAPAAPAQIDDWEHKYKVLQGKYDAEVPRMGKQVNDLNDQIGGLYDLIGKMQAAPAAPEEQYAEDTFGVTAQDVEDYGEDLIDVMRRTAQDVAAPEIMRLEADNMQLREQLGGLNNNAAQGARDRMVNQLGGLAENWQDLDADDGFNYWLDTVDPYTGATRRAIFNQAAERNDAQRVAAFFNGYRQEHAAISGPAPIQPAPTNPQVPLEALAAPGRSRAGAATGGAPQESRIYSQAQISQFYREVQKGDWNARADDKLRVENDIIAAAREGRIR